MRRLSIALLVLMVGLASCAVNQEKGTVEGDASSDLLPGPLDDEWSKWVVGKWRVVGESESGKGEGWMTIEPALNGQFLIYRYETKIAEITAEQIQDLKKQVNASDQEIEIFRRTPFQGLEVHTVDERSCQVVGYAFDSLRTMAIGRGRRQGDTEVIEWVWPGQRATSVRTTQRLGDNKAIVAERMTLADGTTMDDWAEMTRKR
jgi:hypothetical protein